MTDKAPISCLTAVLLGLTLLTGCVAAAEEQELVAQPTPQITAPPPQATAEAAEEENGDRSDGIFDIYQYSPGYTYDTWINVYDEADFEAELLSLAGVESVALELTEGLLEVRVQTGRDITAEQLTDLFETVQWRAERANHFQDNRENREHGGQWLAEPPEYLFTIQDGGGATLYEFSGTRFGTNDSQLDLSSYHWYALSWPPQEEAFSFLYSFTERYDNDRDGYYPQQIPTIDGVAAFNYEDFSFLPEQLGFAMYDDIRVVYEQVGAPLRIASQYKRSFMDNTHPYYQNLLLARYDFGLISYKHYRVDYIKIDQEGFIGPRGIRIGDPYTLVLERFPMESEWETEPQGEYFRLELYAACDTESSVDYAGYVDWFHYQDYFGSYQEYFSIEYRFSNQYLTFRIEDDQVVSITIAYAYC